MSKISFGSILTPVGLGLLGYGFGAYIGLLPGADLSSVMLIYAFPISLLGFALSYAQVRGPLPRADHPTPPRVAAPRRATHSPATSPRTKAVSAR